MDKPLTATTILSALTSAGSLSASDLLSRFSSQSTNLYSALDTLTSKNDIEMHGDKEAVRDLFEKLKNISDKDTSYSKKDLLTYINNYNREIDNIWISPSTQGFKKARRTTP